MMRRQKVFIRYQFDIGYLLKPVNIIFLIKEDRLHSLGLHGKHQEPHRSIRGEGAY